MSTNSDFFYTGGGFSDWSGSSAGNFGSSSSSGSSSYSSKPLRERIKDEVKLGYPTSDDSLELGPTFVSYLWLRWIAVAGALALLAISFSMYVLTYGDDDVDTIMCGVAFLLGEAANIGIIAFLTDYYPSYRGGKMTERRFRRFYIHQNAIMYFCVVTTIIFSFTPFLCWAFEGFINGIVAPALLELLRPDKSFSIRYDPKSFNIGWLLGISAGITAIASCWMMLFSVKEFKMKSYNQRLIYIMNKVGAYDDLKRANIARIAELEEEIRMKQREITELKQEILHL